MSEALGIREALETDRGFVLNSWKECLKEFLPKSLSAALPHVTVAVAYETASPDAIAGFAVYSGKTLHFVYVRPPVRKMGVARRLIEPLGIDSFSWRTPPFEARIRPDERGWSYVPRGGP